MCSPLACIIYLFILCVRIGILHIFKEIRKKVVVLSFVCSIIYLSIIVPFRGGERHIGAEQMM